MTPAEEYPNDSIAVTGIGEIIYDGENVLTGEERAVVTAFEKYILSFVSYNKN
ncbi:hypothetical protein Barb7_00192 [Bacteroidales bacterium Barb7]|nr:hypothetical protein Barb7_00192 [Bacteroidales bacterium Barb7]